MIPSSVMAPVFSAIAGVLTFCATMGAGSYLNQVTCGSVVKLKNNIYDGRLHSHEVRYGSGSGQQSVTGMKSKTDHNSYWTIKAPYAKTQCDRGEPLKCGSLIRLQHMATGKYLHSHHFSSPLSSNQEVSAFGENGQGDTGDNWQLVCDDDFWARDAAVRFRHVDTGYFLHMTGATFGRPIAGQYEICAHSASSSGSYWQVMEGVYIKPSDVAGTLSRHDEF